MSCEGGCWRSQYQAWSSGVSNGLALATPIFCVLATEYSASSNTSRIKVGALNKVFKTAFCVIKHAKIFLYLSSNLFININNPSVLVLFRYVATDIEKEFYYRC